MSDERPSATRLLGTVLLDRFRLTAVIGRGSMGTVYHAVDEAEAGSAVAVKVLKSELVPDPEIVERFEREIRATASIDHLHSVSVLDHGRLDDGQLFLVMELLQGRTLQDLVNDEAPLDAQRVARVGAEIALGLDAAHAQGVVHRDLKPENVFLVEEDGTERVKVLDFGLALVATPADDPKRLTAGGLRLGTPAFMAPEYIQDGTHDARSDLYALGVILYELATGVLPFTGRAHEVLNHHLSTPVPPVAKVAPGAHPKWLRATIERLLAKDPSDRFADAAAAARALLEPDTGVPDTPLPQSVSLPEDDDLGPLSEPEPSQAHLPTEPRPPPRYATNNPTYRRDSPRDSLRPPVSRPPPPPVAPEADGVDPNSVLVVLLSAALLILVGAVAAYFLLS